MPLIDASARWTMYVPRPWIGLEPRPIWLHALGDDVLSQEGGSVELVFHDRATKCWARHGRFGGLPWRSESRSMKKARIPIAMKEHREVKLAEDLVTVR
jgi:hypothetical protein